MGVEHTGAAPLVRADFVWKEELERLRAVERVSLSRCLFSAYRLHKIRVSERR
jgi:hypothetical protein